MRKLTGLKGKEYYIRLEELLRKPDGDIWSETVLTGEDAGMKYLISSENTEKALEENAEKTPEQETAEQKMAPGGEDGGIFRERIGRTPKLVICGGGHVSIPIIHMGKMLGFSVTVLEDRPKFADHARAAGADRVICLPFEESLAGIPGDSDSWFVIVTRGHRYDTICLENILAKKYAYVGMMGSRRRTAIVKDQLAQKGISREVLEGVHTPIGLKIGAQTPEEIAVSVMAEIIQVKNSHQKSGGYSEELLRAVLEETERKMVMATIISRKGSAPRDVGTKMLILEDGSTADTIGGGCVESEIIQKALLMMREDRPDFAVCRVDMTMDAAEDEGMVCGGTVEVMLERVQ
ncbi:xanthine dehydrogenase [Lachnoclostridium sp. An169]|uniref:XdhC family protein n=1 Tax=Lachnoclostridium sp. An169 TaxID=1965569 RepID=UPI000B36570E|nr:XdhC/CoxI family protein [Lachnoclostridium sp. An169]OUP85710.1 xanthine dehydrogenase [Lachnoclostridium sp. An169]